MSEKNDAAHGQPDDINQNYLGASIEDKQVTLALGTLRLLNDPQNLHPLSDALANARRLADSYARWEESGELIKHINVCLSDGQVVKMEQSKVSGLCGLHIRRPFAPDAVLHIWREKDDRLDRVLLLGFALGNMDGNVYRYEKSYRNGQTLSLRVEACDDGQLDISVEFTATELAAAACAESHDWLPAVLPAALGLSSIGSFLRRSLPTLSRRRRPNPARLSIREALLAPFALKPDYAHILMLGVTVLAVGFAAMQSGVFNWGSQPESPHEESVKTPAAAPQAPQPSQGPSEVVAVPSEPLVRTAPQHKKPPAERKQGTRRPLSTTDHAAHRRTIRNYPYDPDDLKVGNARELRAAAGYQVSHKTQTGPSSKPLADLLLGSEAIEGTESTSTAKRTTDWRAKVNEFVQKVQFVQPSLREMGWPVTVANGKSGVFRTISVEEYSPLGSKIMLGKTDWIYVEEPEAPLLDSTTKKRMQRGYIHLLNEMGCSVLNDLAEGMFRPRAILKLEYKSDQGKEEQVHTELYVKGRLEWSTREGCPAESGLESGLCAESLKWGQRFRSLRLSEDE